MCKISVMRLPKFIKNYYWWLPFCLYSTNANAWGLITHLYYAESLIWAMPLLDPRLQKVIKTFPELVLAGACLPDLAVVSRIHRQTHLWEVAQKAILEAQSDEELAVAIGYASHLYVDVIAHNHFVPAHEAKWHKNEVLTHIVSEWAMDGYLAPLMKTSPRILLNKHHELLTTFVSTQFKCQEKITRTALKRLAFWDGILRLVKLPTLIYGFVRLLDKRVHHHFVYYVANTQMAIREIGKTLDGHNPILEPELNNLSVEELDIWREKCFGHLREFQPKPVKYFTEQV